MGKIIPKDEAGLTREEPNPAWAFAVGMLYVFGTRPGWRLLRQLEGAIRRYAADPTALMKLLRERETTDIIEVKEGPQLPPSE
jgi:hypothetical protein